MGLEVFLACCTVYVQYTWVVFIAPCCSYRLGCLRPIFQNSLGKSLNRIFFIFILMYLPKLYKRVYLVFSFNLVIAAAFMEEFTSYLP
jgi:hypothetical protein